MVDPRVIAIITVSLFITFLSIPYILAVKYQHVEPYPATSISGTGHDFPECIFFRGSAIPLCVLIAFTCYMQYQHLSEIMRNCTIRRRANPLIFWLGFLAAFAFSISTAYLSDYDMRHQIHIMFATATFLLTFVQMLVVVFTFHQIRFVTGNFFLKVTLFRLILIDYQTKSYYFKIILLIFGIADLFVNTFGKKFNNFGLGPHTDNICEWLGAQLITLYFLTIAWDLTGFKIKQIPVKNF